MTNENKQGNENLEQKVEKLSIKERILAGAIGAGCLPVGAGLSYFPFTSSFQEFTGNFVGTIMTEGGPIGLLSGPMFFIMAYTLSAGYGVVLMEKCAYRIYSAIKGHSVDLSVIFEKDYDDIPPVPL